MPCTSCFLVQHKYRLKVQGVPKGYCLVFKMYRIRYKVKMYHIRFKVHCLQSGSATQVSYYLGLKVYRIRVEGVKV